MIMSAAEWKKMTVKESENSIEVGLRVLADLKPTKRERLLAIGKQALDLAMNIESGSH
jgi:hypothetical protein